MKTIVTLTAPTCSGKSTVEEELEKLGYKRAISHTTRPPREGEQNGVHYHFVDEPLFNDCHNQFIEKVIYGGYQYGVHESCVNSLKDGDTLVIVCEPSGVLHVKSWCAANNTLHVPIYLDTHMTVCYERLLGRWLSEYTSVVQHCILTQPSHKYVDEQVAKLQKQYALRLSSMAEEFGWKTGCLEWGCVSICTEGLTPQQVAAKVLEVVGIYKTEGL